MTQRRLLLALALTAGVAALEFWGGIRAGSLVLLTDGVHVCMDVFALGIALAALIGAARPADRRATFGYGRLEVLGALLNGTLLLAATIVIVIEAARRFAAPVEPHGALMSIVASVGLIVNASIGFLLLHESKHNMNVRAALFHVAGDALGAIAVIAGGALIAFTGAAWVDPLLSLLVAALIVAGIARVLRDATDVLLESVPRGVDMLDVRAQLRNVRGVVEVHDLHLWTIGSGERALSAHVLLDDRRISEATAVLHDIEATARGRYGVTHFTVQFECESCAPDERIVCTQQRQGTAAARTSGGL